VADALDALANAAPDDIKADFKTFADAFKQFAKAYGDVKLKPGETPSAEQIAKLTELSKSFNTAKLQQATQHLAAWGQSHCGLSSTG
jgi:ABC-type Zn uptake system ZnuABC Zn-binding protein ZnuA